MHHIDVFEVVDNLNTARVAMVTICREDNGGGMPNYSYYLRGEATGDYVLIQDMRAMSAQEARLFERHELKDLVQAKLNYSSEDDWSFHRTTRTLWDDSAVASPEMTARDWLNNLDYKFTDD